MAWLWRDDPPTAPAPAPPALPGPRQVESAPVPAPAPEQPPEVRPEPPRQASAAAPVIDEITVEKKEVCEGEENLVTVRAHTPDGTDPFLRYMVGSMQGQRVPVRSWLSDEGEPRRVTVKVFGRNNVVTEAEVPAFVVKRCQPPRMAVVTARLRANTWSEFDFEAKVIEAASPDGGTGSTFRPRSYEWSFGDGQTAVTEVPHVVHSFEGRRQDTQFSNLLIEVKIRGNADAPVVGRTSLQLLNPAFESLAFKGVVSIMVQLTPRFPELGSDGVVRQKVRLFHHQEQPVYIHQATLVRHRKDSQEPVVPHAVDPSALLGGSMIPPGYGLEFEARLDTRQDPEVFSAEYQLEGKDSEGLPARGAFSVMRPPPRPTRDNNMPVNDPLLKAKILAAQKLLNQQYVTDEDLWRLEREGRFAGLEAQVASTPTPQRPERDPRDEPERDPGPPPPGPTAAPGTQDDRTVSPKPPRPR